MTRATTRRADRGQGLPLTHAIALGLLHGPTELLPISSSGHTTLVPWLADWPYRRLDPEWRKSFEVALHMGTAIALLAHPPWETTCARQGRNPRDDGIQAEGQGGKLGFLLAAVVPPAVAGYTLGGQIERRLGTPASVAVGLLAGSAAMTLAELLFPARDRMGRAGGAGGGDSRRAAAASPRDGLALGLAQACALMPGVSRSGATRAVARSRGFSRLDADGLSWRVGLPVIAGAALLKSTRFARAGEGAASGLGLPLAAGAASAFLSTLASVTALTPERRSRLLPACVLYRVALALFALLRMREHPSWSASSRRK